MVMDVMGVDGSEGLAGVDESEGLAKQSQRGWMCNAVGVTYESCQVLGSSFCVLPLQGKKASQPLQKWRTRTPPPCCVQLIQPPAFKAHCQ